MPESTRPTFPQGEFAAFSTAKMSHFLMLSTTLRDADISQFFGDDEQYVSRGANGTLTLQLPDQPLIVGKSGELFARFVNGKYKVIDADYYFKNFNAPLADENDTGITEV